MTTIFLADCQQLFIDGLKEMLKGRKDLEVTGSAITEAELNHLLQHQPPDLLILDYLVAEGNPIKFVSHLKKQYPDLILLILTSYPGSRYFGRILTLGINGYLLKDTSKSRFLSSIDRILQGEIIIMNEVLNEKAQSAVSKYRSNPKIENLTGREIQVLQYIMREFSNKEIAKLLHLSTGTIDSHRKNIIGKLGVKNTVGLIKYAIYNDLID